MAFTTSGQETEWALLLQPRSPHGARKLDVFSDVCLFVGLCVCRHDNFRTSQYVMMKLEGGVGALYKNLGRIRICGPQPPCVRTPKNVAFGYDIGKISAGCLVLILKCNFSRFSELSDAIITHSYVP